MVQLFTAWPSTCTTQAPHWLVSQPTCVPVSRRLLPEERTSSVRGSTFAVTALPFTVIDTEAMHSSTELGIQGGRPYWPLCAACCNRISAKRESMLKASFVLVDEIFCR